MATTPDADEPGLPPRLQELLDRLPSLPGVYLMKDHRGRVIYVGKARNLRQRVRSYFSRSSSDSRAFIALLDRLLADVETVVTNNEKEALLLENNLIKQHQPRFNVNLRDDKNFIVLRLDPKAEYPRLEVVRRIRDDGARYFGPYHSATSARQTLRVVNRHFKLRTCTDQVLHSRTRPCLQYQIKRCDAPCVFPVADEVYGEQVRDVSLFLEGRDRELLDRLRGRMKEAAGQLAFEVAAAIRDQLQSLGRALEEQQVVAEELRDQDVFGYYRDGTAVELVVLFVRGGKLLGRRTFHLTGQELRDDEILSSFVSLYYDLGSFVPDEVLLPLPIEDQTAKGEWLRDRRGRKVEVLSPRRGPRVRLLELAAKNARSAYESRRDQKRDALEALARVQERLGLKRSPRRIECFDISHLQGTATVASMTVFVDGEPAKGEYRKFTVRSAGNDDFAAMYEVISRRFRRSLRPAGDAAPWPLPDLVVIDGGKGQLASAMAALSDLGVDTGADGLDAIGLAKERETADGTQEPDRVFLPRAKEAIRLRANSAELHVLARIRDEAHRFAITFQREKRKQRAFTSVLDAIPGIGPQRRQALLRQLGSLQRIRAATLEELAAVPGLGQAAAQAVHRHFAGPTSPPGPGAPTDGGSGEIAEDAAAAELDALAESEPESESDSRFAASPPVAAGKSSARASL